MDAMFNQKLLEFTKDLGTLNSKREQPVAELSMLENGIQLMSAVDPGAPLRLFRQHVSVPYGKHIEARDDKFFLDSSDLDPSHSNDVNLVNLLRTVWKTLSVHDQGAIWAHMQLLLKIEKKIAEKQ